MPLPAFLKGSWPPPEWHQTYLQYDLHSAWYSGDMERLANYYYAHLINPFDRRSSFWAQQARGQRRTMVHVPLASDIAQISSAMLFGEHPKIRIPEAYEQGASAEAKASQAALEDLLAETNAYRIFLEAADACSGLGGVILKVNWDERVSPYPILNIAQVDNAIPEFRFGVMTAVTLWRELENDGSVVWRLLERHEPGIIEEGLYKGTPEELGNRFPLTYRPDTADYPEFVETGLPGLACVYIPNLLPNRKFRGSYVGKSDIDSAESLMDSLDETYTSWMRDIRLGKSRIMVPEAYLEKDTIRGEMLFDADQEVYVGLNIVSDGTGTNQIETNQFAIRMAEHQQTVLDLMDRCISNAGYSPASFGLHVDARIESGIGLKIREQRSYSTTAKKAEYWRPAIQYLVYVMQVIFATKLGGKISPEIPSVEMQDSVRSDITEVAQSVNQLRQAQAASTDVLVGLVHPDWDQDAVAAEVKRIQSETGQAVPDPMQIGQA